MTFRVDVLTLFPSAITDYSATSVLGRAAEKNVWELHVHDVRDFATDAHRSVDDTPFGGGAGMVLKPEPVLRALEADPMMARPVIALSPSGRVFNQETARTLSTGAGYTLVCGRYEGFDQRILDNVDDEISLGDYVVAGGELAALIVIEAVIRLLPGALGNDESPVSESFSDGLLEYPQYTKPSEFRGSRVPEILLSGDHGRIERWRSAQALRRTIERRADLIERRGGLSASDEALLREFPEFGSNQPNG